MLSHAMQPSCKNLKDLSGLKLGIHHARNRIRLAALSKRPPVLLSADGVTCCFLFPGEK